MSLAGQAAAAAQKPYSTMDYYNVEVGPVGLRFQGDLGIELNDNVNLSKSNPQADLIFRPTLTTRLLWPVTDQNSLDLSIGVGYIEYLKTSSLDRWYVAPGSDLAFHMYVGDFVFDFHERISLTEDVAQNAPTVTGTGALTLLDNTTGVGVTWDLNKLILAFGYDHDIEEAISGGFASSDHSSDTVYARATLTISSRTSVGLLIGGGETTYDQPVFPDSKNVSAGPFFFMQLTPYLGASVSAGLASYWFSPVATALTNQQSTFVAYYGDITLNHRLNRWLSESLSVGRQIQGGISSAVQDEYYLRYSAQWQIIHSTTLSTTFSYQRSTQVNGLAVTYSQYSAGLNLGYRLTQKWSGGVNYQIYVENSSVSSIGYVQNRIVFDFAYAF